MSAAPTWSGSCTSRGLGVLGAGIGLLAIAVGVGVLLAAGGPVLGWVLVGAGLLVALLSWWASRLRVVVDAACLRVSWGPTGWPRKRIRWARVRDVSAIQVEPAHWGGWGYRWIPWAHASAAVVRRGPGIKLDLVHGKAFVVTVDDAVNGAKAAAAAARAAAVSEQRAARRSGSR